jgi:damage-control phosphatase, subfamily I
MNARPECIACLFTQALNTARMASTDPLLHVRVLKEVAAYVSTRAHLNQTPAALSQPLYELVSRLTGVSDPYAAKKSETNEIALELLPAIEPFLAAAVDPLDAALHAAVAGNIIDFGIGHSFDIRKDILPVLTQPFATEALEDFRAELMPGRRVMYLGDNCGEIVFDSLLVREILKTGARVTFAVKSGPIINDATMADARQAGLTDLVPVMETGVNDVGTVIERCSPAFRREFEQADLIVAKGHGNFETCNDTHGNFYFLLKIKCQVVAQELGIPAGQIVFMHQRG